MRCERDRGIPPPHGGGGGHPSRARPTWAIYDAELGKSRVRCEAWWRGPSDGDRAAPALKGLGLGGALPTPPTPRPPPPLRGAGCRRPGRIASAPPRRRRLLGVVLADERQRQEVGLRDLGVLA